MLRARSLLIGLVVGAGLVVPGPAAAGDPSPSADELRFAALLNEERKQRGIPAVAVSPALTDIAHDYVAENDRLDDIDHGRDAPYTARTREVGCDKWDGPVLALGTEGPQEALDIWMNSTGHREVLLDPEVTHLGPGLQGNAALAFLLVCKPGSPATTGAVAPGPPAPAPAPTPTPSPPAPAPGPADRRAFVVGHASVLRARAAGRVVTVPVRVAKGTTTFRLVLRRGREVRRVTRKLSARAKAHRVSLRVPRRGRWTIDVLVISGGKKGEAESFVDVRR
jgi:hypothetical protein